jgi:Ca2+-transporting ATPase
LLEEKQKTFFQTLSASEALRALDSNASGLSDAEAKARLARYGPNALKAKKKQSALSMFLAQFKDFLILLLLAAAVISFFLQEELDAIAIMAIVVLNAVIGFTQEYRAEKAIEALKKLAAPKARVVRGGSEARIDAASLVPGDVVVLEEGDKIPADCRLLETVALEADEASLTGESMPVKKEADARVAERAAVNDWRNCLFLGTAVTRGRGRAVVFATGMQTQIGGIAKMVEESGEEDTPLQRKLDAMGKQLGAAALAICAIIFIVGVLRGGTPVMEMFLIAVALAVAAIPEGLPAVVTIALAIGVQRMARKHSIIRRLPAVEALGSATVICTDKTGTLTKSELTVRRFFVNKEFVDVRGEGYSLRGEFMQKGKTVSPLKNKELFELMQASVLCNNAALAFREGDENAEITGDPTEACLLVAAEKAGIDYKEAQAGNAFVSEIPFDSKRKMMTVIRKTRGGGGGLRAFVKGAPEMVLERSAFVLENGRERKLTAKDKKAFLEANTKMASAALRVLGFAYRAVSAGEAKKPDAASVESRLVFIGLAGMIDPPRQEAKEAIAACHSAGIRVIMVTGDNPYTAQAIGEELGLRSSGKRAVVNGAEINEMSDAALSRAVRDIVVFARVAPEHKLRIVKALKANGEVVAMTGDGVNDAPALKAGDIGVAMGITGTDVAKEASDMVITDDNFASIERAVEEGRIVYDNIVKAVRYLLSCNIGELFTIFFAVIAGLPSPLTPIQILWMNIVTDSPPALALAMNPADPDVMRRKPRDPKENILSRSFLIDMAWVGALLTLVVLGIFYADLKGVLPMEELKAGTMAFSVIVLFQKFFAFEAGCPRNKTILEAGVFRNKWLLLSFAFGLGTQLLITEWAPAQAVFQTAALNAFDWVLVLALASTALVLPEIAKVLKGETRAEKAAA